MTKLSFLVLCAVLLGGCGEAETVGAVVVEKVFTPASSGVGVGPNIGGRGGTAVVVTSSSEEWTVLLQEAATGEVFSYRAVPEQWNAAAVGDTWLCQRSWWMTSCEAQDV